MSSYRSNSASVVWSAARGLAPSTSEPASRAMTNLYVSSNGDSLAGARAASIGLDVCSAACCWSAASDISQRRTKLSLASSSLAQLLAVHFPRETKDGEMLTNSFTEVKEEPKWGARTKGHWRKRHLPAW